MAELEAAVGQSLVPVEALGGPHRTLRALRPLLFADTAALAGSPLLGALPASVALAHLFSRAPPGLPSPHARSGFTPAQARCSLRTPALQPCLDLHALLLFCLARACRTAAPGPRPRWRAACRICSPTALVEAAPLRAYCVTCPRRTPAPGPRPRRRAAPGVCSPTALSEAIAAHVYCVDRTCCTSALGSRPRWRAASCPAALQPRLQLQPCLCGRSAHGPCARPTYVLGHPAQYSLWLDQHSPEEAAKYVRSALEACAPAVRGEPGFDELYPLMLRLCSPASHAA
jgi:hypothetical protein